MTFFLLEAYSSAFQVQPKVIYTVWYIPSYNCNDGMLGMLLILCSKKLSACTSLYALSTQDHKASAYRSRGFNRLVSSLFNNKLCWLSASLKGGNFLCEQVFPTGNDIIIKQPDKSLNFFPLPSYWSQLALVLHQYGILLILPIYGILLILK